MPKILEQVKKNIDLVQSIAKGMRKSSEPEALNSHVCDDIYKAIGIDPKALGCIMLDVKGEFPMYPDQSVYYVSDNPDEFWIKGFVGAVNPHVTLLQGLLQSGPDWRPFIDQVLTGWKPSNVMIESVGCFPAPEDYPCTPVIAHVTCTPELLAAHQRLSFLPHIDEFPVYTPHVTIAYVQNTPAIIAQVVKFYSDSCVGQTLTPCGINYGGNPTTSA